MHEELEEHAARISALLRSKLRRPAVPEYFVPRPRLDLILDAATTRPLTLVIAPAGSGKTQLLSNWVAHSDLRTVWLSLEEIDDDAAGLWTGVIAAVRMLVPDAGATAAALLARRAAFVDVVIALLDDIDVEGVDDAVLVLDDIHHLTSADAVDSLATFVQHLPAWLHVVIGGRADPQLPLDRMRGRGQLVEVRFPELRLTPAEARLMLLNLTPDLSDDELTASAAQTEGWAAGLQLTALAARSGAAEGEAPRPWRHDTQLLTEDYVWHEVLATGDADIVELLLQLSVVDRFNTPLAIAISGEPDARRMLLRGEAQGLFVYRLDAEDWFRIHPLVREALLSELRRRGTEREYHERAARWLEDAGETVTALEQWLKSGRPREALRLLSARTTQLYDQGREALIARTLDAIPRDVVAEDVPALIDLAVSHIMFGPLDRFLESVREAVWYAERADADYSPRIEALQAIALATSGDWTAGACSARRALAGLGETWWSDPAGRFAWNTIARAVALSESWDDDAETVREATMAARRDPRRGIALEGVRAVGDALAGRPVDALRVAAGVRPAAATMSILRAELDLAEAVARLELGDRTRALAELRAVADRPDEPRLFCPVGAMLHLAAAAVDDGDAGRASVELERARALVAAVAAGPDLMGWVRRAAVVVSIAIGDVDGANLNAAALTDTFWAPVSRARLEIALGDIAGAAEHLAGAVPRCPRHQVILGLLSARAATTPDLLLEHATCAVELASHHGMLQTVVSDGRELTDVIERAAWRVPPEWLRRLRLAMAPSGLAPRAPTRDLPEVLTDRERDVLRLLPSRLTVSEIAGELYVSVNTVKFHLRIIYRKLGVNSREEAAQVARSMTRTSHSTTS